MFSVDNNAWKRALGDHLRSQKIILWLCTFFRGKLQNQQWLRHCASWCWTLFLKDEDNSFSLTYIERTTLVIALSPSHLPSAAALLHRTPSHRDMLAAKVDNFTKKIYLDQLGLGQLVLEQLSRQTAYATERSSHNGQLSALSWRRWSLDSCHDSSDPRERRLHVRHLAVTKRLHMHRFVLTTEEGGCRTSCSRHVLTFCLVESAAVAFSMRAVPVLSGNVRKTCDVTRRQCKTRPAVSGRCTCLRTLFCETLTCAPWENGADGETY